MIWKRVILSWMTLLALVFASVGATAVTDVSPKPHVGAIDLVAAICIEASGLASAEERLGNWDAVTTGTSDVPDAARGAGAVLPKALQGGEAVNRVYFGVRNGERVYVGITNNLARRQAEHGGRFLLERITQSPVTRGEARAIEQALIKNNPGFENMRNSISPNHSWYGQAVERGEAWLKAAGY